MIYSVQCRHQTFQLEISELETLNFISQFLFEFYHIQDISQYHWYVYYEMPQLLEVKLLRRLNADFSLKENCVQSYDVLIALREDEVFQFFRGTTRTDKSEYVTSSDTFSRYFMSNILQSSSSSSGEVTAQGVGETFQRYQPRIPVVLSTYTDYRQENNLYSTVSTPNVPYIHQSGQPRREVGSQPEAASYFGSKFASTSYGPVGGHQNCSARWIVDPEQHQAAPRVPFNDPLEHGIEANSYRRFPVSSAVSGYPSLVYQRDHHGSFSTEKAPFQTPNYGNYSNYVNSRRSYNNSATSMNPFSDLSNIHQEISNNSTARLATYSGDGRVPGSTDSKPLSAAPREPSAQGFICVICCDNTVSMKFDPCKHVRTCESCCRELLKSGTTRKCPICRKEVDRTEKVFLS